MRKGFWLATGRTGKFYLPFVLLLIAGTASAQLNIRDFVLFGGNGNCPSSGQTTPLFPGCGVQIGTSGSVTGGKIGSYSLVKTTGNAQISAGA